MDLLQKVLKVQ